VLIFDLGGGTFDVSLLTIDEGIFEVGAAQRMNLVPALLLPPRDRYCQALCSGLQLAASIVPLPPRLGNPLSAAAGQGHRGRHPPGRRGL
jgi:hypothetical protein